MRWVRSILAVLAGILVIGVGSTATDAALQAMGIFPPFSEHAFATPLLLIATAQRAVWAILASFVTAWLAPSAPMTHALVFGAIGVVLNIVGAIVMWQAGAHWYPVTLAAISLPCAWIGGRLAR
ncbi:MAG TPA: hypothetical protein VHZ78_10860 [Rhizomicrobium sp.]|jgi:hypothetical protein|nr:hypothetical protein [Rhizomicrobium sp.]